MIVKLDYEGPSIYGIKTKGELEKQRYMRYSVDEYSIRRCLEETETDKWVVGIDYRGGLQELQGVEYKEGYKPVIYKVELEEIELEEVEKIKKEVPEWVRLVLKLPDGYNNMRKVKELGEKHPEVRVCGGRLVRLAGCKIGCITEADIPREVTDMKKLYATDGCGCVQLTKDISELYNYEIMYEEEKEVVESLADLLKM